MTYFLVHSMQINILKVFITRSQWLEEISRNKFGCRKFMSMLTQGRQGQSIILKDLFLLDIMICLFRGKQM